MTPPPRVSELSPLISRSVPFLLHCAAFHSTRCVADALAPLGIEPRQFGVLCTLKSSGPQSQGGIGERLGIDRTTMVQLVDELEQRGLVERQRNPNDRRSYQLTLTPVGQQTVDEARELAEGSEEQVLAMLDDEERDALRELLARVVIAHDQP
jgi:DNA-binding MarR family transcriptional regulator